MKEHHPPIIDAAINLDMIGHLKNNLILQGTGSSTDWQSLIQKSNKHFPFHIVTQSDPYLPTDSTAFYVKGIPTLNFFTGAGVNYHTIEDKACTLNYEGINHISHFLVMLVDTLLKQNHFMPYHEMPIQKDSTDREVNIYLGTIPDYAANTTGVKLSGIAFNSPAAQAGLSKGDTIIELASKPIQNIYDYTYILNSLHVGKSYKLFAIRGKRIISMTITPRYRE